MSSPLLLQHTNFSAVLILELSLCLSLRTLQLRALRSDADPTHLQEAESAAAAAREVRMRAAERGITLAQQQAQDRVRAFSIGRVIIFYLL